MASITNKVTNFINDSIKNVKQDIKDARQLPSIRSRDIEVQTDNSGGIIPPINTKRTTYNEPNPDNLPSTLHNSNKEKDVTNDSYIEETSQIEYRNIPQIGYNSKSGPETNNKASGGTFHNVSSAIGSMMHYAVQHKAPQAITGVTLLGGMASMALGNNKGQKTNAELYSNPF